MLLAWICGCQPLAPGKIEAIAGPANASHRCRVYLVRGWRDLYSSGMDQLCDELQQHGIDAAVFRESQWQALEQAIVKANQEGAAHGPLVLIGFSYGADDVVRMSRKLQPDGISPDLLITIDPVTPPKVPSNVRSCYNYFQTNGIWDIFPWLRGIPLKSDGANVINIDLRRQRPDLVETDTVHSNIAANPKLHEEIILRVLTLCPRGELTQQGIGLRRRS